MADPLSIAGLVTGVISLGLQVTSGLTDYLDAVKGRTEDLKSATQGATEMRDLLLTIQDLLPQVESSWPASATMIKRHVKSCNAELGALHTLLSELSQPGPFGSGLRSRLADTKKKLSYPFERSQISRIEERLAKVNSALQTALQVTELNVSITSANQIREVHNLVVSLSQSQASLQTQSAGACLSLTTTRKIPGATNMGLAVPLDSVKTAISLASKPSLLSRSIKTLEDFNAIQPPSRDVSQVCLCRPSRKIAHHRRRWGYLSFSYQTSSTRRHLPDCPLSEIDDETHASKLTIEYSGLRKLFQTAFALTLMNSRGAGGRSISPGFSYYPTVDGQTAPAFCVMALATGYIYYNTHWNEAAMRTLQCCYDAIFRLYRERRASPKDITSDGESLVHVMRGISYEDPPFVADATLIMMMNLVACGVPLATYNTRGYTPAGYILLHSDNIDSNISLAKFLLPEPDLPLVQKRLALDLGLAIHLKRCLQDLELAEASQCGPLSLAARVGDERLVQEFIKRYPQSLEEVNDFGHTPLHLAIKHPPCLRLILEAGGSSMLAKSEAEPEGWTPLVCACYLGYRESVQLLLAAGAYISFYYSAVYDKFCLDDVLIALKQRRDELKLLALENLTQAEARAFGLHEEKVLDGCALEVWRRLFERGVVVPSCVHDSLLSSVYYSLHIDDSRIRPIFDRLWALGFRDVNSCDGSGRGPLILGSSGGCERVRWLIEHGADYWTPFSGMSSTETSTATPAHFLSGWIGSLYLLFYEDGDQYDKRVKTWQWLVEKLMQVQVSDACTCPCFGGGCTPLKGFFDHHRNGWVSKKGRTVQDLARWCAGLTITFQASFSENDLMATLRRMTFDALGLTHTCCNLDRSIYSYYESLHTLEEVDEINSEQGPLLTLFDNLLVEFNQIAHEDQDGKPLIVHDPEGFWMRRWLPRVEEALEILDGDDLTAEERSAAETVGVKWGPQPVQKVKKKGKDLYTPEWVMEQLERILNE